MRYNVRMKKLLYLHGFASSGSSGTVELLRHEFLGHGEADRVQVIAPDIPVDPAEALPMLKALVEKETPDLIVGTSLGGAYAQQLRGIDRICVNPSLATSKLYSLLHVGKYKWLNRRRDGELEFHVYKETIQHFAEMEAHQFDGWCEEDALFCRGLFGDEDEISAASRPEFERRYPDGVTVFHGGHRMNADLVHAVLIPAIRETGALGRG